MPIADYNPLANGYHEEAIVCIAIASSGLWCTIVYTM